jgi:hypothetical protein
LKRSSSASIARTSQAPPFLKFFIEPHHLFFVEGERRKDMKTLIVTSTAVAMGLALLGSAQAQRAYYSSDYRSGYDTPAAIPGAVVGGAVTTGGDIMGGAFTAGDTIVGGILGPIFGPFDNNNSGFGAPVRAQPAAYGSFDGRPGCRPARALVDGNWRRAVICP